MKKLAKSLIIAAAAAVGALHSASANPITLTFDENGNVTGLAGILHQQGLDSFGVGSIRATGLTTLDYLKPASGTDFTANGWVAIYDAGNHISDLIHFDNSIIINGNLYQQLFFYSADTTGGRLADVFPTGSELTTILAAPSTVNLVEGAGDITPVYTPTSSQPGFHTPTSTPFSYVFKSNVPDGGTTGILLGLGLAGIGWLRRMLK